MPNVTCAWTVAALPSTQALRIALIANFSVPSSDRLLFYDGDTIDESTLFETYFPPLDASAAAQFSFITPGNAVTIVFHADALVNKRAGRYVSFLATPMATLLHCNSVPTVLTLAHNESGTITEPSPYNPLGSSWYPPNKQCSWTFTTTDPSQIVRVTVTPGLQIGDTVRGFDGNSTNAVELPLATSAPNTTWYSSGVSFHFLFTSGPASKLRDDGGYGFGFSLRYEAVDGPLQCGAHRVFSVTQTFGGQGIFRVPNISPGLLPGSVFSCGTVFTYAAGKSLTLEPYPMTGAGVDLYIFQGNDTSGPLLDHMKSPWSGAINFYQFLPVFVVYNGTDVKNNLLQLNYYVTTTTDRCSDGETRFTVTGTSFQVLRFPSPSGQFAYTGPGTCSFIYKAPGGTVYTRFSNYDLNPGDTLSFVDVRPDGSNVTLVTFTGKSPAGEYYNGNETRYIFTTSDTLKVVLTAGYCPLSTARGFAYTIRKAVVPTGQCNPSHVVTMQAANLTNVPANFDRYAMETTYTPNQICRYNYTCNNPPVGDPYGCTLAFPAYLLGPNDVINVYNNASGGPGSYIGSLRGYYGGAIDPNIALMNEFYAIQGFFVEFIAGPRVDNFTLGSGFCYFVTELGDTPSSPDCFADQYTGQFYSPLNSPIPVAAPFSRMYPNLYCSWNYVAVAPGLNGLGINLAFDQMGSYARLRVIGHDGNYTRGQTSGFVTYLDCRGASCRNVETCPYYTSWDPSNVLLNVPNRVMTVIFETFEQGQILSEGCFHATAYPMPWHSYPSYQFTQPFMSQQMIYPEFYQTYIPGRLYKWTITSQYNGRIHLIIDYGSCSGPIIHPSSSVVIFDGPQDFGANYTTTIPRPYQTNLYSSGRAVTVVWQAPVEPSLFAFPVLTTYGVESNAVMCKGVQELVALAVEQVILAPFGGINTIATIPSQQTCGYHILADDGLQVYAFHYSELSSDAYVRFYDGSSSSAPLLPYDGSIDVHSSGNELFIEYYSGSIPFQTGLHGLYAFYFAANLTAILECHTTEHVWLPTANNVYTFPRGGLAAGYPPNCNLTVVFEAEYGSYISGTIRGQTEVGDVATISEFNQPLVSGSGTGAFGNFRSVCNQVVLTFITNDVVTEDDQYIEILIYGTSYFGYGILPGPCRRSQSSGVCGDIVLGTNASDVAQCVLAYGTVYDNASAPNRAPLLETIMGTLFISYDSDVNLPLLRNVYHFSICGGGFRTSNVSLPLLRTVYQNFRVGSTSLRQLSLPSLRYAYCPGVLYTSALRNLSLPALEYGYDVFAESNFIESVTVGKALVLTDAVLLTNCPLLREVNIDVQAAYIRIDTCPRLDTLVFTSWRDTGNTLDIQQNSALTTVSLPNCRYLIGLTLAYNLKLSSLNAPSLLVSGAISVTATTLHTASFPVLSSATSISLIGNNFLLNFEAPSLFLTNSLTITNGLLSRVSLPSLRYVSIVTLQGLSFVSTIDACALQNMYALTASEMRSLSCFDIANVFNDVLVTAPPLLAPPDCDGSTSGTFGCTSGVTFTVADCYRLSCIQNAIDLAPDNRNSRVLVTGGTYTGCDVSLDLRGKSITLTGTGLSTVVDCQQLGKALVIHGAESSATVIREFWFRNGRSQSAGGLVSITGGASPQFVECRFQNSYSGSDGGAVSIADGSHPTFVNCQFIINTASGVGGAIAVSNAAVTIVGSLIQNNMAGGEGGGVSIQGATGTSTVTSTIISRNTAARGGGLFADGPLVVCDVQVMNNTATQFGGGLALVPVEPLHTAANLTEMTIAFNRAATGGGIYSFSANLALNESVVSGNAAGGDAGGLLATCSENYRYLNFVAGACSVHVSVTAVNFTDNTAGGLGGAVRFEDVFATVSDSYFTSNQAASGGAVASSSTVLSIQDCSFTGNSATALGGALHCEPLTGICGVSSTTFQSNSAGTAGGAVFLCAAGCPGVNASTGAAVQFGVLPNFRAMSLGNVFVSGSNGVAFGGYGAEIASDPAALVWINPPPDTAISGRSMVTTTPITVSVRDAFGQTVTAYSSVLAVSLFTFLPNGASATNWAAVAGSQTVLATNGVASFSGISIVASHAEYLNVLYKLRARLSPFSGVIVESPVTLLPCAPGRGKPPDQEAIVCNDCGAGTFGTGDGDYSCNSCAPGSYAAALSTACSLCPADTSAPFAGAASCTPCQAGFTAPVGSAECTGTAAVADTGADLGIVFGAVLGVLFVIGVIVALLIRRFARARTVKKYYLDSDSTVRTGAIESTLQRTVKKMIVAASTSRIGGGVYADIYKARYEDKWIALKVLKGEMIGNATALREFQRETVALNRINEKRHPGIVQLKFFLQKNPMCIGMEFCSGGTVKAALASPLKLSMKLRMVAEAASGMVVLHSLNIAHLDLKTDNLLLDDDMHVKLADFGISRTLGSDAVSMPTEYVDLSSTSTGPLSPFPATASEIGGNLESVEMMAVNPIFGSTEAFDSVAPPPPPRPPQTLDSAASVPHPSMGLPLPPVGSPPVHSGQLNFNPTFNRRETLNSRRVSSGDALRPVAGSVGGQSQASLLQAEADGEVAFTPQYVDPMRIVRDRPNDMDFLKQADIYSFSMVMWAVMGQTEPYAGETPAAVMEKLRANPQLRPNTPPDAPKFYAQLMQSCWDAARDARPSFNDVLATMLTGIKEDVPETELLTGYFG